MINTVDSVTDAMRLWLTCFVGGLEVFSCYIAEDYFISKAIFNRLAPYPIYPNTLNVTYSKL